MKMLAKPGFFTSGVVFLEDSQTRGFVNQTVHLGQHIPGGVIFTFLDKAVKSLEFCFQASPGRSISTVPDRIPLNISKG